MKKILIISLICIVVTLTIGISVYISNIDNNKVYINYIESNSERKLPGSFYRENNNLITLVTVEDNHRLVSSMEINGFNYNGNYEIYIIKGKNKTLYDKGNSKGIVKFPNDKNSYEINFFYDRVSYYQENFEKKLSDKNLLPNEVVELELYTVKLDENGIPTRFNRLYTEVPFVIKPMDNKLCLEYIDFIQYYVYVSKNPIAEYARDKTNIANVRFKIEDGKYVFYDWEILSDNIQLVRTTSEGEAIFIKYDDEYISLTVLQDYVLKQNVKIIDK